MSQQHAEAMSVFPEFNESTTAFICHLHDAWRSNASLLTYVKIRDRLLAQHNDVETQIATLIAVVNVVHPGQIAYERTVDPQWEETFDVAASIEARDNGNDIAGPKKRKRAYNESSRVRNVALIAALWSPQVVLHYKWNTAAQGHLKLLRACATQYPRFTEDFCPRLNAVLLRRHCEALISGHQRSLNEAPLQPHRDFDLTSLASTLVEECEESLWVTTTDGAVPVGDRGKLLRDLRPHHFELYFLQKDLYGMLVSRIRQSSNLELASNVMGASTITSDRPITVDASFELYAAHQELRSLCPTTAALPNVIFDILPPYELPIEDVAGSEQEIGSRAASEHRSTSKLQDTSPTSESASASTRSGSSEAPQLHEDSGNEFEFVDQDISSLYSPDSPSQLGPGDEQYHVAITPGSTCAHTSEVQQPTPSRFSKRPCRSEKASLRPVVPNELPGSHSVPDLTVSTAPFPCGEDLTLEEALHNRHCSRLMSYASLLLSEAAEAPQDSLLRVRQEWLKPTTRWAVLWSSGGDTLPRSRVASAAEAQVLYFTSDDFVMAAASGQAFSTPIVIKEQFSDSGMHTVHGFTSLLRDASGQETLDVRGLNDKQPRSMNLDDFIKSARSRKGRDKGLNALNLRNLTKAHRPLFTMLTRFRLLETLVERVAYDLEKQTESVLLDVASCIGFNILGLEGAFSGAHVDSLNGTWVRNLDGVKYWMIVPADEMELVWDDFTAVGDEWLPCGKERLIVLEPDDILFLPPGLRVVHAVHSPTRCLMEGGMLWDELNLLQTLQSIHWTCENQLATNEAVAYQLPRIITELDLLIQAQPNRFLNGESVHVFKRSFNDVVNALKDLGCCCASASCQQCCPCRMGGRRCTSWCFGHPFVPRIDCMDEATMFLNQYY